MHYLKAFLLGVRDGWRQPYELASSTNVEHLGGQDDMMVQEWLDRGSIAGQFLRAPIKHQPRVEPAVAEPADTPPVRFTIEHEVQYTRFTVHFGFTTFEAADIAGQDMFGHHAVTGWQGGDSWEAWCEPAQPGGEVALHVDIVVRDEEWEQALWRAQDVAAELAGFLSRQPVTFEHRRPIDTVWLTRTDDWSENEWLITAATTAP